MSKLNFDKTLYVFELDDVLFPRKDYILQIYYLFASFFEFTEGTIKANELANFMKKVYEVHGEGAVFDAAKEVFGIDEKYRENLARLIANGQVPLRLNLFPEVEKTLLTLFQKGKQVAILTKGNPVEQLNKLKFIDWGSVNEFKNKLKIYFEDELTFTSLNPISYIAEVYDIQVNDICEMK